LLLTVATQRQKKKQTKITKNMKIINLIQIQQINILNRSLNKNKLFRSSVTNLRGVRCWPQGGFWCSVRNYHISYEDRYYLMMDREREREEFNNKYKIS
jgi:hypothetical protein